MPLPANALPYGIRDVMLKPYVVGSETPGTGVDLPAMQTLSFEEAEDFEELRGDDVLIAVRGKGPVVNWDLEHGGLAQAALAVMAGGTVTSSGTTPAQQRTFQKKGTDVRPYFKAEGQAMGDLGGDVHTVLHKCRANGSIQGEHGDGAFWVTSASGIAIPKTSDMVLYEFIYNETPVAVV